MIGSKVIVDTNIFIDLMRGDLAVAKKIESFSEVFISPVVLVELYFGAYRSARPEQNILKISSAIEQSLVLLIDSVTAETFVAVKLGLLANGYPIPENDIWIASAAIQHRIPVYTNDNHFNNV